MARFSYSAGDDLLNQLKRLNNTDEIAIKMLDSAAPIITKAVKASIARHNDTGRMIASVKEKKATKTKNGYSVTVRPTGKDSKGVRNMEKLVYIEYGTSKQRAAPVLKAALASVENDVTNKMQETFDKEAGE